MPQPRAPANVRFIWTGEHSPRVPGCCGNPLDQTTQLDAPAARGARFTSAYTPFPICVPVRACPLTGRYAHQLGSRDSTPMPNPSGIVFR